jgi:hypothetical protein
MHMDNFLGPILSIINKQVLQLDEEIPVEKQSIIPYCRSEKLMDASITHGSPLLVSFSLSHT